MISPESLTTIIYVLADDFCQAHPELVRACRGRRGPAPQLAPAETMTLALISQWERFDGERGFWRFAQQRLHGLFPALPHRSQFNRAARRLEPLLAGFFQHLADLLGARGATYEILDRFGVATRRSGRRGEGWLGEYANKGKCTRLGFFHGVQVLSAVTPEGVITGLAVAPGSTKDQPMAGALFRARHQRQNQEVGSASIATAGRPAGSQIYLADKGFSGPNRHREWFATTGALLVCAPQKGHAPEWPASLRRIIASMRQIVETVHEKLLRRFHLEKERPHSMGGFFTRLCAKAALHNFCIWFNRQLGRRDLAFADLLGW